MNQNWTHQNIKYEFVTSFQWQAKSLWLIDPVELVFLPVGSLSVWLPGYTGARLANNISI